MVVVSVKVHVEVHRIAGSHHKQREWKPANGSEHDDKLLLGDTRAK